MHVKDICPQDVPDSKIHSRHNVSVPCILWIIHQHNMRHSSALMEHYQFQRQITFSEHTCFVFLHCNHCKKLNKLNTAVLYSDQQWPNIPTFFHQISLLGTKKKANYISELINTSTSTPLTFKILLLPQSTCMYKYIISGIEYFGEITQSHKRNRKM